MTLGQGPEGVRGHGVPIYAEEEDVRLLPWGFNPVATDIVDQGLLAAGTKGDDPFFISFSEHLDVPAIP